MDDQLVARRARGGTRRAARSAPVVTCSSSGVDLERRARPWPRTSRSRVLQQLVDGRAVNGVESDADARLDVQVIPSSRSGCLDRPGASAPPGRRRDHVGRLRREDAELVAAEPRHGVARPDRLAQPARHLLQQHVARVVAERVVDLLEAVEIEHHDRQRRVRERSAASTACSIRSLKSVRFGRSVRSSCSAWCWIVPICARSRCVIRRSSGMNMRKTASITTWSTAAIGMKARRRRLRDRRIVLLEQSTPVADPGGLKLV